MKRFKQCLSVGLLSLLTSGCSLFSVKEYQIVSDSVSKVSMHNLSILSHCNINNTNYLYVDEKGKVTIHNLFLYVNDLNEDLNILKSCVASLEKYNTTVLKQVNKI